MANVIRWDPLGQLAEMSNSMDRMFGRGVVRPWRVVTWENGHEFFPVDLYETEEEVVVKASLPGLKAENVSISVTGRTLTIKGESAQEEEEQRPEYYRHERHEGTFQRTLTLPVKVDADKADATFRDGVLDLHLAKAADVLPKTIEVKAS